MDVHDLTVLLTVYIGRQDELNIFDDENLAHLAEKGWVIRKDNAWETTGKFDGLMAKVAAVPL